MSLAFLSVDTAAGPVARSPLAHAAATAGASVEVHQGWAVVGTYGDPAAELAACRETAGFADVSPLGKLELQGGAEQLQAAAPGRLEPGAALTGGDVWWCGVARGRALLLCQPEATAALRERLLDEGELHVVDLTCALAALCIAGPLARETLARFCALDLRDAALPVGGFRPGSVARTPGAVLRTGRDRFVMLFGAALAGYVWTVVADAARHLGGGPVGSQALVAIGEAGAHA